MKRVTLRLTDLYFNMLCRIAKHDDRSHNAELVFLIKNRLNFLQKNDENFSSEENAGKTENDCVSPHKTA